ncbi:MAG: hypothetical protein NZ480_02310 [Bdellovibrionaceae bacterium]|nr:hypothetical protein [Pseudobdellovibrionaceae bacterium]MDW8191175.1 hypothetical protein [Pseudobdellovibrionaceae bacterium]
MDLIQLMEQKNHFLEQFYSLNELQVKLLRAGAVETLDEFYQKREKILEILRYLDGQIHQIMDTPTYKHVGTHDFPHSQVKKDLQKALKIKEEYVFRIMEQELQILSLMDEIKSAILKELIEIQSQKKALRGYHSKTTENQLKEKA